MFAQFKTMEVSKLLKIRHNLKFILIAVISALFLLRILLFIPKFGGIEHDSAWYLGVAKLFAEKGIYASYTNTISFINFGSSISIHDKYSVQDQEGYIYFPAGVTVGPIFVFPQALILKLLGNGFWQYRLWPLITYAAFLGLLFYFALRLGGYLSLSLLALWLWVLPQLTINYAYLGFSENIALIFLLLSFWFWSLAFNNLNSKTLPFLSGLMLSLSALTKLLFLINGSVLGLIFLYELYKYRHQFLKILLRWVIFAAGLVIPLAAFELYRFIALSLQFGIPAWETVNKEIAMTFQMSGSGLSNLLTCALDENFIVKKTRVLLDIGIYRQILVGLFLVGFPFLIKTFKRDRLLVFLLYSTTLISLYWFIFLSSTGWARHVFQGLVILMLLICAATGRLFILKSKWHSTKIFAVLMILLFFIPLLTSPKTSTALILSQQDIDKWWEYREERGIQGFPFAAIVPVSAQEEVVNFIDNNLSHQEKIYYHSRFLLADISTLTGKIFYPVGRFITTGEYLTTTENSYLILGPYQLSSYKLVDDNYEQKVSEIWCEETVFENDLYKICRIKKFSKESAPKQII